MNATQKIQQAMAEGKIKIGVCASKKCEHNGAETTVYRVKDEFVCGECLDKFEKLIKELEARGVKL